MKIYIYIASGCLLFGVLGGGCVFGIAFNCKKKARAGVGFVGMADGLPGGVAGCVRVLWLSWVLGLFVRVFGGVLSNKKRRRADGVKIG